MMTSLTCYQPHGYCGRFAADVATAAPDSWDQQLEDCLSLFENEDRRTKGMAAGGVPSPASSREDYGSPSASTASEDTESDLSLSPPCGSPHYYQHHDLTSTKVPQVSTCGRGMRRERSGSGSVMAPPAPASDLKTLLGSGSPFKQPCSPDLRDPAPRCRSTNQGFPAPMSSSGSAGFSRDLQMGGGSPPVATSSPNHGTGNSTGSDTGSLQFQRPEAPEFCFMNLDCGDLEYETHTHHALTQRVTVAASPHVEIHSNRTSPHILQDLDYQPPAKHARLTMPPNTEVPMPGHFPHHHLLEYSDTRVFTSLENPSPQRTLNSGQQLQDSCGGIPQVPLPACLPLIPCLPQSEPGMGSVDYSGGCEGTPYGHVYPNATYNGPNCARPASSVSESSASAESFASDTTAEAGPSCTISHLPARSLPGGSLSGGPLHGGPLQGDFPITPESSQFIEDQIQEILSRLPSYEEHVAMKVKSEFPSNAPGNRDGCCESGSTSNFAASDAIQNGGGDVASRSGAGGIRSGQHQTSDFSWRCGGVDPVKSEEEPALDCKATLKKITDTLANLGGGQIQLWQFILELLADAKNAACITWDNSEGQFTVRDPEDLARRWGKRKNRAKMNYDKLSRALRYYYDKLILTKVPGRRYTYRFNLRTLLKQVQKPSGGAGAHPGGGGAYNDYDKAYETLMQLPAEAREILCQSVHPPAQ